MTGSESCFTDNSGRVVTWGEVGSSRGKTEAIETSTVPFLSPWKCHWGSILRKWCPLLTKSGIASPWPKGKLQNVQLWAKVPGSPVHRIASGDASESIFFSRKRGAHENRWQWLIPQAVFPDRHRTPAKSEFQINKTIVWYKFVSNIAWDLLILRRHVLFIWNSNLAEHLVFLFANLTALDKVC